MLCTDTFAMKVKSGQFLLQLEVRSFSLCVDLILQKHVLNWLENIRRICYNKTEVTVQSSSAEWKNVCYRHPKVTALMCGS